MARQKLTSAQLIKQLSAELTGQQLITVPMSPTTEVAVVIPVFAEQAARLERLLTSVVMQHLDLKKIEVIMVINNRATDNTKEWQTAYELNQEILRLPIFGNRIGEAPGIFHTWTRSIREQLAVYAIDKSSPGLWVPQSNVGRARQRGLAEAALRFAQIGRNGLVVHTDADCWFDDPAFMFKLLWLFAERPDIHALGGIYTLELDVNDPEAEDMLSRLPNYKLYRIYRLLCSDINKGKAGRTKPLTTLGRCIVHRAFEGIEIGGIPPVSYCEDHQFCEGFEKSGLNFVSGADWGIGVGSAMRISDRTPASQRNELLTYGAPDAPVKVEDVLSGGMTELNDNYIRRLADVVRAMPNGPARLEYVFLQSPLMRMRIVGR
jgi:hypothetical protein